ncbi:MAG: AEC family transporter [Myxococcales bacterium]|nr:AEC family transporter [Myxococcales bacterium]
MIQGRTVLSALLEVVIPVFVIAGIGFVYAAKNPFPVSVVTDMIIYVTAPCLVFNALSSGDKLTLDAARTPLSAVLVIFGGVGLALLVRRWIPPFRSIHRGAVALPAAFMNSGNLGLPMAQLAMGQPGFEVAMLFFVTFCVLLLTVGVTLAAGRAAGGVLFRFPLLYATILGLLVNQLQLSLPKTVTIPVDMLAQTVVPMMLIALGARLRSMMEHQRMKFPIGLVVGIVALRFVGGVLIALLVNALLGNQGYVRNVTLLSGCLPSGVMNFAFVEKFADDPYASAIVSAAIALSTLVAVLVLPVWVMLVR